MNQTPDSSFDPRIGVRASFPRYLALHQGSEAAPEFQKILDYRGLVWNSPTGALARLQLGRGYALQGDTTKAKGAYQDLLALWKDADPDIPVLKEAEYAKLQ